MHFDGMESSGMIVGPGTGSRSYVSTVRTLIRGPARGEVSCEYLPLRTVQLEVHIPFLSLLAYLSREISRDF